MEIRMLRYCLFLLCINSLLFCSKAQSPTLADILRKNNGVGVSSHYEEEIGQSTTTTNAGMSEDLNHECARPCLPDTPAQRCMYHFKVEWYVSMSKACYNCPFNATDCLRPHCAAADGFERPLATVNRRLPGPAIHVCEGDEIVVDIENDLVSDSTSIHWHGVYQRGTPYMDGVPLLTQCPISPGTTFRYNFLAANPGTHYWHSHSALQRTDGMFGAFVIRSRSDSHKDLYDFDDPKHVLVLTDWMDKLGVDKFVNHHHTEHENKPYNILINGMGKYKQIEKDGQKAFTPVYEIVVKKGQRYRLRTIGNSIQNCPIQISVDNHTIEAIASDGQNIVPVKVQSLTVFGGERWDFVVEANQPLGVYWIKFKGLLDCDARFKSAHQVVLLRYEGATENAENFSSITYNSTHRDGLELNRLNAAPGDMVSFMTSADIRSYKSTYDDESYHKTPNLKFWLEYDFYGKDNDWFHHEDFYPFFGVVKSKQMYVPQINHITMKLPSSPPLSQPDIVNEETFCNSSSRTDCQTDFCHCPHVLQVPLGSLVEVILVDRGVVYWANHPFHLHGHSFAVMAMGRLGENTTVKDIHQLDESGQLIRNFVNPPIKDSVTVPDGGYTVIRFIADNPGYWLFHCHISFHAETGMGLVFKVGERTHIPPVPRGFPRCNSFVPLPQDNLKEFVDRWTFSNPSLKVLANETNPRDVDAPAYSYAKSSKNSATSLSSNFQFLINQILPLIVLVLITIQN